MLLSLTWWTPPASAGELGITDDLGRQVRLNGPAKRVICLYGGLTETVAALGCQDLLVARTKADDHPAEVAALPSIGTHMRPNLELVAALAPDLVLQQAGRDEALAVAQDIEDLGIPVALFHPESFEDLFSVMLRVGTLLNADDQAQGLVTGLRQRLDQVDQALDGITDRPGVVFEIRYPNLLVAGQASMITEIMHRAGATNPVAKESKLVRLSEEELLRLDPDAYLVQHGPMNPSPLPPEDRPLFKDLQAVRSGRVLVVEEALFSRPGPRSVQAVEQLARFLHAERFTDKQ